MSTEKPAEETANKPAEETATPATDIAKLTERISQLETERKGIAKERDEMRTKLKQIEDEESIKKGDLQKVLTEKEKEIEILKAEKTDAELKASEWVKYQEEKRKNLIDQLKKPELQKIAGELKGLEILEDFVKIHTQKTVGVDNGNANEPPTDLTAEQKAEAQRMGLSEKNYKEVMEYRNKLKKT